MGRIVAIYNAAGDGLPRGKWCHDAVDGDVTLLAVAALTPVQVLAFYGEMEAALVDIRTAYGLWGAGGAAFEGRRDAAAAAVPEATDAPSKLSRGGQVRLLAPGATAAAIGQRRAAADAATAATSAAAQLREVELAPHVQADRDVQKMKGAVDDAKCAVGVAKAAYEGAVAVLQRLERDIAALRARRKELRREARAATSKKPKS